MRFRVRGWVGDIKSPLACTRVNAFEKGHCNVPFPLEVQASVSMKVARHLVKDFIFRAPSPMLVQNLKTRRLYRSVRYLFNAMPGGGE